MKKASSHKAIPAIHERPLGDERKYLKAMAHRFPGTIQFETGCGHIIHDLLARLPSIPQMEEQKAALCHCVVEAVHPLAACLFAQSVSMTITTTGDPLPPPEVIAGLATYTVFDIGDDVMRHCFLSAPDGVASLPMLGISSGLAVMCEPLGYGVHVVNTGVGGVSHNKTGAIWEWTERIVSAWYEQRANQPLVPVRLQLRTSLLTEGQIVGVTDSVAMATLASTTGVPNTALPGKPAETHHITPSFMHEAGFAETASQPRAATPQQPRQLTPVQSPNALPVDPNTGKPLPPGVTDPNAVAKPDAAPKDAHGHLHHPHGPDAKPDVT